MLDLSNLINLQGGQGNPALDQMRLLELKNKLDEAPLRKQKLQAETLIKTNEALELEMKNFKERADILYEQSKQEREARKSRQSFFSEFTQLFKDEGFETAKGFLESTVEGSTVEMNDDGTATVIMPKQKRVGVGENGRPQFVQTKDRIPIIVDPNRLTQERRLQVEKDYSSRFDSADIIQQYKNYYAGAQRVRALVGEGTGAGDLAIVNVFARTIQGGTGIVTESDVANAMMTVGVSEAWANRIAKAWKNDAPLFGEFEYDQDGNVKNIGQARKNFVSAIDSIVEASRNDVLVYGRDMIEAAERQGVDPRNILTPVGDISEKEFFIKDEDVDDVIFGEAGQ